MDGGDTAKHDTAKLVDELAAVCRARGISQLRVGDVQIVMGPPPVVAVERSAVHAAAEALAVQADAKRERLRRLLGRVPTEGELEALP